VTGFLAVVGVLTFLWVGFELSSGAGEEVVNPKRDAPVMIVISGAMGRSSTARDPGDPPGHPQELLECLWRALASPLSFL
jgi:hypothetical protein